MRRYLILIYLAVMLAIVVMLFIPSWRRVAARISAACDYPLQKLTAFLKTQFDKLKKRKLSFKAAKLWYYGIVDGIINLTILLFCRKELSNRIGILCIMLYRFEIGDNLRDKWLQPVQKKKKNP